QLPGSDRQIGITVALAVEVAPTASVFGVGFWNELISAGEDEGFEDCGLQFSSAGTIGHAVDFGEHEAGDGVIVIGSFATAARSEHTVGLLTAQDEIDRL